MHINTYIFMSVYSFITQVSVILSFKIKFMFQMV